MVAHALVDVIIIICWRRYCLLWRDNCLWRLTLANQNTNRNVVTVVSMDIIIKLNLPQDKGVSWDFFNSARYPNKMYKKQFPGPTARPLYYSFARRLQGCGWRPRQDAICSLSTWSTPTTLGTTARARTTKCAYIIVFDIGVLMLNHWSPSSNSVYYLTHSCWYFVWNNSLRP